MKADAKSYLNKTNVCARWRKRVKQLLMFDIAKSVHQPRSIGHILCFLRENDVTLNFLCGKLWAIIRVSERAVHIDTWTTKIGSCTQQMHQQYSKLHGVIGLEVQDYVITERPGNGDPWICKLVGRHSTILNYIKYVLLLSSWDPAFFYSAHLAFRPGLAVTIRILADFNY